MLEQKQPNKDMLEMIKEMIKQHQQIIEFNQATLKAFSTPIVQLCRNPREVVKE